MKKKGKAEKQKGESSLKTGAILAALLTAVAVFAVMVQMEKVHLATAQYNICPSIFSFL